MTPEDWYRKTIGQKIDTDKYPRSNPYQCWDYFDFFCRYIKFNGSRYCSITGYAGDLWKLRNQYGYYEVFDFVEPDDIKEGDWLFWDKHVAFYYHGLEVGQNQNGKTYVSDMVLNRYGLLGGMRWKGWTYSYNGVAEHFSTLACDEWVTTANVHIRTGGSTKYTSLYIVPKGTIVDCYGYYHMEGDVPWLYVCYKRNDDYITGFICSKYLERR